MTLFDAGGWQTDASTECLNNSLFGQLTTARVSINKKSGRSRVEASSGSQQHEKKRVKQSGQKRPKCDTNEEKQTVITKKSKSHDSSDSGRVLTSDSSQTQSGRTTDTQQTTTEHSQEQVGQTRTCEPKRKPNKRNKYKHLILNRSTQSVKKEVDSEDVHNESKKNNKQQKKRKRKQPSTGDGLVQDVATRTQPTEVTPNSEPPMKKKKKKRKLKKGASDTTTDGVREAAMDDTSSVHKRHKAADAASDAETESVTTAPVTSTGTRKNHKDVCKTGDGKNSKKVTTPTTTTQTVDSSSASVSPTGHCVTLKKTVTPVSAVKSVTRQSPFNIARLKAVFRHELPGPADTPQGSPGGSGKDSDSKTQDNTTECKSDRKQATKHSTPQTLREKMQEKLNSARFRYINEQLYRSTGEQAHRLFSEDPETFEVYHEGYQAQVAKWPVNPVNKVIEYISARPTSLVVADLGCGDAKVSRAVKNRVLSFDLVAVNDSVTACDISKLPLEDGSVDIAVFCLSLMGTDFVQFLCEANRILRLGGKLLVAEVVSRFDKIGAFVRKLTKLGFSLQDKDTSNTMFVWFEFMKIGKPDMEKLPKIVLTPCVYKKR